MMLVLQPAQPEHVSVTEVRGTHVPMQLLLSLIWVI